jgi:hypothetical protein
VSISDFSSPVAIDYTSRDFFSLREDLIERVRARVGSWFGNDPADFALALVEAFSYVGDVLGYYTDRVANEGSLLTATQRSSILALAASAGYTPNGFSSAFCTVRVTSQSDQAVELPAGAEISGNYLVGDAVESVVFTTSASATVPANGTASVLAFHGEAISSRYPLAANAASTDIAAETLGISNGEPAQRFFLQETEVALDSLRVFVQYGDSYGIWAVSSFLPDAGPTDPAYSVVVDAENRVSVIFGDGVSGAIPTAFAAIKAQYTVGGGVRGNIPSNTLNTLVRIPGMTDNQVFSLAGVLTFTNPDTGVGGSDPDSVEVIRAAAEQSVRTNDRAVTLRDYGSLTFRAANVAKASAVASTFASITVFAAPVRTTAVGDPYPLYDESNTALTLEWSGLRSAIEDVLEPRRQIGATVTVSPPTYIDISCSVLYTRAAGFSSAEVTGALQVRLLDAFSYINTNFNATIYPEQVEAVLREVPGATNVQVTALHRGASAARDILVAQPGELFYFDPSELEIIPASGEASVTALTPSSGTLSPAFSAEFFNYTLLVATAATTVNITAVTSAAARFTIAGVVATSQVAQAVLLPTATTVVPIVVVAQDGVTQNSYRLTIVKA